MALNPVDVESNLSMTIGKVQSLLDGYFEALKESASNKVLKEITYFEFTKIFGQYISLSQTEHEQLEKSKIAFSLLSYLLHYRLVKLFKDVALLHRDVLLQLHISSHKYLEGTLSDEKRDNHFLESKQVLLEAMENLISKVQEELILAKRLGQRKEGIPSKIKHFQNPWNTYAKQFELLLGHFKSIEKSGAIVEKTIETFQKLRSYSISVLEQSVAFSEELETNSKETINRIGKLYGADEIPQLIHDLEQLENGLTINLGIQENFTQSISEIGQNLGKTNLPVATEGGMLLEKTVDFGKSVKKWMDFNLIPGMVDFWEQQTDLIEYAQLGILNLKGSLTVAKSKQDAIAGIQGRSLDAMKKNLFEKVKAQKEHSNDILKKLREEFLATKIYHKDDFLEVSMQRSFVQYSYETNNNFSKFIKKLKSLSGFVNKAYDTALSTNTVNPVESATQCIGKRMFKEENAQYDTLFLNRSFLGELFLAPRKEKEEVFERCIAHWENGFNKAVLVDGDSLCGKTTFINKMIGRASQKNSVFLTPDSTISFQGRKYSTTKNLNEILREIKKSSFGSRTLVIIDDLEEWHDKDHSLLGNARGLVKFIESESDNILVVVGISKLTKDHLNKRLAFSNSFTTHIDLSQASHAEIAEAIGLRHGASHRMLIGEKGEALSERKVDKLVARVAKRYGHNLGEVLQAWTYGTRLSEDNTVLYQESLVNFPDFFSSEEAIILKYVMLYRKVNERILKTFLGKGYGRVYESGLKRLVNTKVLVRETNGFLALNEVVQYDVKQILIYRGIIS
jgi:uridine kinase